MFEGEGLIEVEFLIAQLSTLCRRKWPDNGVEAVAGGQKPKIIFGFIVVLIEMVERFVTRTGPRRSVLMQFSLLIAVAPVAVAGPVLSICQHIPSFLLCLLPGYNSSNVLSFLHPHLPVECPHVPTSGHPGGIEP